MVMKYFRKVLSGILISVLMIFIFSDFTKQIDPSKSIPWNQKTYSGSVISANILVRVGGEYNKGTVAALQDQLELNICCQ
jgi:hypothetical protein